jgi:hypothetical protein
MLENTFEEYLKNSKIWYPNGALNPQQIELERKNYKEAKFRKEDQNYFEPVVENDSSLKDLIKTDLLNSTLLYENDFIITICPSFEEGFLFHILNRKSEVEITKSKLNKQDSLHRITIDSKTGKLLNDVLNKAFISARKKRIPCFHLDGTIYSITRKINNKYQTIFKHSPDKNTWTERLLKLFEYSYLENKESIEELNNELNLLLEEKTA